jgi:uncharacterized protein
MESPLIRALQVPAIYPHPVDQVELIETHISWVFLAGEYAYKIKKPVNLGFVDFSTLDKRRHYCQEELRLNRRHAADLYVDVVTLGGEESAPLFGADEGVIEYAVRMRRFDTRLGFDRMLAESRLKDEHVRALARQMAALHKQAEIADFYSGFGTFTQVAAPMCDNLEVLARLLPDSGQERIGRLRSWTESELQNHRAMIDRRLDQGFVRECHGDAHLGNVTMFRGQVRLFDCIEFSEDLRWIDVINDVAFTIMDLHDRKASSLAWTLLDEYLTRTGDFEGLALLGLYVVYRALVRAKVKVLLLEDRDIKADKRQALAKEVCEYLHLAHDLTLPPAPKLIITIGLSGSGKSWLAEQLLGSCGMIRLRSDVERKRLFDLNSDQDSRSGLSTGIYSQEATEKTYGTLLDIAESLLARGYSVIVDATFTRRDQRKAFRQLSNRLKVPLGMIFCHAEPAILRQRIQSRNAAGTDPSEAGLEVLDKQLQSFEPPGDEELDNTLVIDTTDQDALDQARFWMTKVW